MMIEDHDCLAAIKVLITYLMSSVTPLLKMRQHSSKQRPHFDPSQLIHRQCPTTPSSVWRTMRCVCRLSAVLAWSLIGCGLQMLCVILPGKMNLLFPLLFWRVLCFLLGINIRQLGTMAGHLSSRKDGRRVVFVSNHTSWLDVLVLGSVLPVFFIAKADVRNWPFIGFLTRIGGTIYITRNRQEAAQNVQNVLERLIKGYNIAFFPEGTTSDGSAVRPFLSSLFAIAKPTKKEKERERKTGQELPPLLIQPISLTYDQLEGLPVGRSRRASVFSWFGDMYLMPHVWSLGKWRSMRATILFHEPLKPEDFPSRKALASASYDLIRRGNEALRQNRVDPSSPHRL